MRYIAQKSMTVGPGKGRQVGPGDEVPEAATWPSLRVYLADGSVEAVEDGEPAPPAPTPRPPPASASADPIPSDDDLDDDDESDEEEADEEEDEQPEALEYDCPHCDAEAGQPCVTTSGNPTSPHAARG